MPRASLLSCAQKTQEKQFSARVFLPQGLIPWHHCLYFPFSSSPNGLSVFKQRYCHKEISWSRLLLEPFINCYFQCKSKCSPLKQFGPSGLAWTVRIAANSLLRPLPFTEWGAISPYFAELATSLRSSGWGSFHFPLLRSPLLTGEEHLAFL